MSKFSIQEISLEGFRGIYNKNTLEFGDNCRGIILYGDNGTGKTSFSEGAEWLFYDKIEKLNKEGCNIKDARHLRFPVSEKACVGIKTSDGKLITKSIDNDGKISITQPANDDFLKKVSKDNIILSYTKLRDFVDKTKKEKLVSFLAVSGYGSVTEIRDELKKSLGKIEQEIEGAVLESKINGYKEQIANKARDILGQDVNEDSVDPEKGKEFVRNLLKALSKKYDLQLNFDDEVSDLIKGVEEIVSKDITGKDFLQIEEFQRLTKSITIDKELQHQINDIASRTRELLNDKNKIETLSLGSFYQRGKELFEKLGYSKDICPFCDQKIANSDLQKLIDEKLILSSNLNNEKNKLLEDFDDLGRKMRAVAQNIKAAQNYYKNSLDNSSAFQDISPDVALISYRRDLESLNKPKELIAENIAGFVQRAQDTVKKLEDLYSQKSKTIAKPSKKLNEISEAIIKIKDVNSAFTDLEKQSKIKKEFENQRQTLEEVLGLYEQFEKQTMKSILQTMSEDINLFYSILHKQDEHEDVRLDFTDKRGITFKLSFHKKDVDQPIKYLSDAHLNSLGLCFFLASVKHLNQSTNFVILDDVVNSIDANHRRQLVEIIRDHFSDNQFLILTHDETWFGMLNEQLRGMGWKPHEIISWQLESVVIEPTKDKLQKVQDLINCSNGEAVASHLRKYFEQELKRLCKLYHVSVGYKEDFRTEDLWQPFKDHLKADTHIDPDSQKHKGLFNDIQTNKYLFNLNLHDSSKKVSKGDMQYALDKYKTFLDLFRCQECTNAVKPNKSGYQCNCGYKFTA